MQVLRTQPKPEEPINLFDLVGFGDPARSNLDQAWKERGFQDLYRVPIGLDDHGNPVQVDFKWLLAGIGIHGAPGSGKSELLRSILFGLAATHPSSLVNFVCLDPHGSHTFRGIEELPHTSFAGTPKDVDLDRINEALQGEIYRRHDHLDRFKSLADHEKARLSGTDLEPLPLTVLAIDSLPELLKHNEQFEMLYASLVRRRGYSGLVFVYTASDLDAPILRSGLLAPTKIALWSSAEDSEAILGSPAACDLPSPGHGVLDSSSVFGESHGQTRFRAAYTGLPHGPSSGDDSPTIAQVFAERLRGQAAPARTVIPRPLGDPSGLDSVLPPLQVSEERGFNTGEVPHRPWTVIGLIDNTSQQRHDSLVLDFTGSGANLAIVGRLGSGKTTAVQTVLLGLALTGTPRDVRFHCLDFGGGGLAPLRDLPHTRIVAASHDADHVELAVAGLEELLTNREQSFARHEISSIDEFRRRRATDELDEASTDHFLVVDGWLELLQHQRSTSRIMRLAGRGPAYGIHVFVTANRWDDLPRDIRDLTGHRIELRLPEPRDSLISAEKAEKVPEKSPGHGVYRKQRCVINAPVLGEEVPGDLGPKTRELVKRIDDSWFGARPPQLRRLPAIVGYDELPSAEPGIFPLGLDSSGRPVHCSVANSAEHHLLVMGGEKSGRSTAVRTVLRSISKAYTKEQAMVLCIDFRREYHLTDLDDLLLAYIRSPKEAESALRDTVAALRKRLPGPDTGKHWSGPEAFVVIDDYDLLTGELANLCGMSELLPYAADIGLHLILACDGHRYANSDTIIPFVSNSATKLVLKDALCPAGFKGERGDQPRTPGEAVLTGRIDQQYQRIALRVAWIPHPLET
ncbi:type VII secretion protein EccCb [Saccharopolyspora shandongensis]|uniref:type VII secretion protein EccCb n=1 Tax=Saccharopolyspora shandongensis TaxID=418495 RepID=UPI0033C74068